MKALGAAAANTAWYTGYLECSTPPTDISGFFSEELQVSLTLARACSGSAAGNSFFFSARRCCPASPPGLIFFAHADPLPLFVCLKNLSGFFHIRISPSTLHSTNRTKDRPAAGFSGDSLPRCTAPPARDRRLHHERKRGCFLQGVWLRACVVSLIRAGVAPPAGFRATYRRIREYFKYSHGWGPSYLFTHTQRLLL